MSDLQLSQCELIQAQPIIFHWLCPPSKSRMNFSFCRITNRNLVSWVVVMVEDPSRFGWLPRGKHTQKCGKSVVSLRTWSINGRFFHISAASQRSRSRATAAAAEEEFLQCDSGPVIQSLVRVRWSRSTQINRFWVDSPENTRFLTIQESKQIQLCM